MTSQSPRGERSEPDSTRSSVEPSVAPAAERPVHLVLLAEPRGFCAGVEMAIKALAWMVRSFPPPIYCYHEIVHNKIVVERFERQGVIFVDDVEDVPPGSPIMLSAHGSAPEVVAAAEARGSYVVDSVCPLVTKVHHEVKVRAGKGYRIVYVGHDGHEEAVGTMAVAPEAALFGFAGGRTLPVARLRLVPGDRIRWHEDASGRADLLELRPPVKGVADDRSAVVYAWEVRKTRREIEEAVGKRVRVGTLRDLKVVRRGVSGRIVALEVVGSRGRQTVRGFDVRNLLDLRETLAAFEIQRDGEGDIVAVAFHGKGWGHGVGLCQVGAYGMALRGEGYRAILAHYYPGTTLSGGP